MKITLDVHELHIKSQGEKHFSEIEVKKLPVGDVIYKNICIERKEINDFISSITGKGRVFQQARNMVANFPSENCYVIIVGKQQAAVFNKKIRFSVDQFLAAQASLAQLVHVMTVDNHNSILETLFILIWLKSILPSSRPITERHQPLPSHSVPIIH